jgi:putative oxidoreductase
VSAFHAFLARYTEEAYAFMRIVVPFLYLCHGLQKWFGVLGGMNGQTVWGGPPIFIAAGLIEVPTGILMMLGLFTTPAAFLASCEMAVAYFKVHAPQGFWPVLNHGEIAVAFCLVFLYIACKGSGIWSLDGLRRR